MPAKSSSSNGSDEAEREEKIVQATLAHVGQLLKMVSPLKDQEFYEWDRQVHAWRAVDEICYE